MTSDIGEDPSRPEELPPRALKGTPWDRLWAISRSRTGYVFMATIATAIVRIGSTMVLTRLLNAEVFGVMGLLGTINVIFGLLTDLGFFQYVVRQKDYDDPIFLDEVWTLRLIRSMALVVGITIASPFIAHFVHQPGLEIAIIAISFVMLIEGLSSLAYATEVRTGRVGRLSIMDFISYSSQVVVSIVIAIFYPNYWALIASTLFGMGLKTALSYAMFPGSRRRFRFSRLRAADVWLTGKYVAASTILTLMLNQSDKVIFARYFSLDTFGLYILAGNLAIVPQMFIASYAERILYPAFCNAAADERADLSRTYYHVGRPLRLLYMFGIGGFIACAPLIIALLYDDRYQGAAFFLGLLSITTLLRLPITTTDQQMIALGKLRNSLQLNIIRVASFAISAPLFFMAFGPVGLIAALVFMEVVALVRCWMVLIGLKLFDIRQELLFAAVAAAGFGLGYVVNWAGVALLH